jgi:hypothetical protein
MATFPVDFELKNPIEWAGDTRNRLVFKRRAIVRDFYDIKMEEIRDVKNLALLFSRLCDEPRPLLDLMSFDDFTRMVETMLPLFVDFPPTGDE